MKNLETTNDKNILSVATMLVAVIMHAVHQMLFGLWVDVIVMSLLSILSVKDYIKDKKLDGFWLSPPFFATLVTTICVLEVAVVSVYFFCK